MNANRNDDVELLIEYVLGRCEPETARAVRGRLESDPAFARLHQNIVNTFSAMDLCVETPPPDGLAAKTMERIRQQSNLTRLITREESSRRRFIRPTFRWTEVGTVAAAMLILAAVFIPAVQKGKQLAERTACASNVGAIGTGLLAYGADYEGQLPSGDDQVARWLPAEEQPAASNSAALFKLIREGYARPTLFQCPAVGSGSFVAAGLTDFPAGRYVGYSYQHALGPESSSRLSLPRIPGEMAILADATPLFERGHFRPDRLRDALSDNHGRTGQNVLYVNGQVIWAQTPNVGVERDDIYSAEGVTAYRGLEQPSDPTDTFLLPNYTGGE